MLHLLFLLGVLACVLASEPPVQRQAPLIVHPAAEKCEYESLDIYRSCIASARSSGQSPQQIIRPTGERVTDSCHRLLSTAMHACMKIYGFPLLYEDTAQSITTREEALKRCDPKADEDFRRCTGDRSNTPAVCRKAKSDFMRLCLMYCGFPLENDEELMATEQPSKLDQLRKLQYQAETQCDRDTIPMLQECRTEYQGHGFKEDDVNYACQKRLQFAPMMKCMQSKGFPDYSWMEADRYFSRPPHEP